MDLCKFAALILAGTVSILYSLAPDELTGLVIEYSPQARILSAQFAYD